MSEIRRFVAMTVAILVAVFLHGVAAQPYAVAAQDEGTGVKFSGEWIMLAFAITNVDIDPSDPESPWRFEAESTSLLYGDFVGIDHSTVTATYDPRTGDQQGWIKETFVGTYEPDGSTGTMTREGPYKANQETGEGRSLQEITGGDGDFEGARGHITIEAIGGRPCVFCGTYKGIWDRPTN
ncbi:MAG: hypothetical protein M3O70_16550 [Actinomycetota bacterium]|nr:hypothetical protein [Actinomycetota bacterium]